jgi:hypothetical protein
MIKAHLTVKSEETSGVIIRFDLACVKFVPSN